MNSFEVVDYIPSRFARSKNLELYTALLKELKGLNGKQAIRKEMGDVNSASSLMHGVRRHFRMNDLQDTYFATVRQEDGKFYTYFGKRKSLS